MIIRALNHRKVILLAGSTTALFAAGLAFTLFSHPSDPGPPPRQLLPFGTNLGSPPPEPPSCAYAGDVANYRSRSRLYPHLPPDIAQDLLVVANSVWFCYHPEPARSGPNSVTSLRRLARGPHAVEAFHELAAKATPAGQLYGAIGLYYTDATSYAREVMRLKKQFGVPLLVLPSDAGYKTTMSEFLEDWPDGAETGSARVHRWVLGDSLEQTRASD